MSILFYPVVCVVLSVAWYWIGKGMATARYNSRLAVAWRQYNERLERGEDATGAVLAEFGMLADKVEHWTFKDVRRIAHEEQLRQRQERKAS